MEEFIMQEFRMWECGIYDAGYWLCGFGHWNRPVRGYIFVEGNKIQIKTS